MTTIMKAINERSSGNNKSTAAKSPNRGDRGDEDEHDEGEWSDNCLYRRMLRGSQRIQMMMKRQQNSLPLLQQALQNAEVEPSVLTGIKVLRINILKSKTFDVRYFTIDQSREFICVTPEPLPPNVLAENNKSYRHYYYSSDPQKKEKAYAPPYQFIDVADIDAWHVGTVATFRAEVARRLETDRSTGGSTFDEVATEKLLTIYYKGGSETLDLVVPVAQQLNMIVSSLSEIHSTFHRAQPWISKESSLLRYIIANQMVPPMESSETITQAEFHKICEMLHVGSNKDAAFCFQSRTNKNTLPFSECIRMLRTLKPKKTQATVLWDFLFGTKNGSGGTGTVTHKDLHRQFLSKIQSESHLSIRQAHAILTFIQTIEIVSDPYYDDSDNNDGDNSLKSQKTALQKDQFEEFLYSDLNDAYDPEIQQMEQRLDQPLSAYWINTSFKTYQIRTTIGNKERTCASVEGYMKALIRGCKCLDLDCWDGPTMPNAKICIPMVGHPMTKATSDNSSNKNNLLLLRHVCGVVEAYLKMHPQSHPIILSIENYCTPPFQEAMALLLHETLGHRLLLPTSQNNNSKDNNSSWDEESTPSLPCLPSPDALRGRVILHSKAHPESSSSTMTTNDKDWVSLFNNNRQQTREMEEIVGGLKQLVFFEGGNLLEGNLDMASSRDHNHKILSLDGSKHKELLQGACGIVKEKDHRKHHASHLTRSHPSSLNNNPNPVHAWSLGCQAVALRLGSCSGDDHDNASVVLNDGLFRQQNGVGYILKPPSILGLEPAQPISLFVRVLGGRCLPTSSPKSHHRQMDLSVWVTLYDVQKNSTNTEAQNDSMMEQVYKDCHKTTSIDGSGFAPVWKDRGKKFGVQQPDIAMVLFQVMGRETSSGGKSASTCVASAAVPVSCLRKGYRSIQFFDKNNCRTGALRYASLLVHVEY
ncbi:unnamed protein product [Cylindrotheca closterium]|uniref:Phosphoinositide phospholipase C n=1 Tax=Cylindrotheca closterium TaxID=2856 RepID=A0AAD2JKR3_9STRA|nr:unnamed protein product [Cylindrotheca closterium]